MCSLLFYLHTVAQRNFFFFLKIQMWSLHFSAKTLICFLQSQPLSSPASPTSSPPDCLLFLKCGCILLHICQFVWAVLSTLNSLLILPLFAYWISILPSRCSLSSSSPIKLILAPTSRGWCFLWGHTVTFISHSYYWFHSKVLQGQRFSPPSPLCPLFIVVINSQQSVNWLFYSSCLKRIGCGQTWLV